MSQIFGHVGNTITQDLGDFVNILELRVRRDLIIAYGLAGPIPYPKEELEEAEKMGLPKLWSVNWLVASGWNSTRPHTQEECDAAIEKLDRIYSKKPALAAVEDECEF